MSYWCANAGRRGCVCGQNTFNERGIIRTEKRNNRIGKEKEGGVGSMK